MFSDVIVERVTVEGTSEIIIAAVSSDVIIEELVMSVCICSNPIMKDHGFCWYPASTFNADGERTYSSFLTGKRLPKLYDLAKEKYPHIPNLVVGSLLAHR